VTLVYDQRRKVHTSVLACRSCGHAVYFSLSRNGKRTPYDVDDKGQPTDTSHFQTCPDARLWTKRK
jgi:hypothetical protein